MAKKKTKAQLEYERLRKNVTAFNRRREGTYNLPATPSQELIGKITAKDYKLYTRELKQFYQNIKELESEKKERERQDIIPFAEVVIENFRQMFNISTEKEAKGRDFVLDWLDKLISSKGDLAVALMLAEAQSKATLSFSANVLYDTNAANVYTQGLQKFLKNNGMSKKDLAKIQQVAEDNEPYLYI